MAISSNAFIALLNKNNSPVIESDRVVDGIVDIKQSDYTCSWLILKNCEFSQPVTFHNVNFGIGVKFIDCKFNDLVFAKGKTQATDADFDYTSDHDSDSIIFENCSVEKLTMRNGAFERGLRFDKATIIEELFIFDLSILKGGIKLAGKTEIKNTLEFYKNTLSNYQGIVFSDCIVSGNVMFQHNIFRSLVFYKSEFHGSLSFWQDQLSSDFVFKSSNFKRNLSIHSVSCDNILYMTGCTYEESVSITYQDKENNSIQGPKRIKIHSSKYNDGIYINGLQNPFDVSPVVKQIEISCSPLLEGEISLNHLDVGEFILNGLNQKSNVSINNFFINKLRIVDFINQGSVTFTNIQRSFTEWFDDENEKIKSANFIHINQSNLGKMQFFQFSFDTFDDVSIHNVILTDISSSVTRWFPDYLFKNINEKDYKKALKSNKEIRNNAKRTLASMFNSKRDVYRQLRLAMEKQSDTKQALEFRSLEMKYYRKYLKYSNSKFWERFILWTGQTNDFGLNWWKATWMGALILFALYIPIVILGSNEIMLRPSFATEDIKLTLRIIFYDKLSVYVQLLNPTHLLSRIDDISVIQGRKIIHFLDFIHRLVTSFFIFQVVVAFRKYLK